jgi:hypothetical protein
MTTDGPQLTGDPLAEVLARLGEHSEHLERLDAALAERDTRFAEAWGLLQSLLPENGGAGAPVPTPRWHVLAGPERVEAIARLASWVEAVYLPVYGHLAGGLGSCWPEHPLALQVLDHLSETWTQLYERPRTQRILSLQMEFQARIVPVVAEQLRAETARCVAHVRPGGGRRG